MQEIRPATVKVKRLLTAAIVIQSIARDIVCVDNEIFEFDIITNGKNGGMILENRAPGKKGNSNDTIPGKTNRRKASWQR